jgi:hypothetical protein
MKYLFLFLLVISSTPTFAQIGGTMSVGPFVDYLRTAPVEVAGQITADTTEMVAHPNFGTWANINKGKSIDFSFSETALRIQTNGGITIKVGYIPFKVRSITVDKNGKFTVDAGMISGPVRQALEDQYKAKMVQAFRELTAMRQKRSLTDANDTITKILNIFSPKAGKSDEKVPNFTGNLALNFRTREERSLSLGLAMMDLKKGQSLQAGIDFRTTGKSGFTILGMFMNAPEGVQFRPGNSRDKKTIASATVKNVCMGRASCFPYATDFNVEYTTGPEEAATGVAILANLILAQAGNLGSAAHCGDEVQIKLIRNIIDRRVNGEMVRLIKENYKDLVAAGIDRKVLRALMAL